MLVTVNGPSNENNLANNVNSGGLSESISTDVNLLNGDDLKRLRDLFRIQCTEFALRDTAIQEEANRAIANQSTRVVLPITAFDAADPSISIKLLLEPSVYLPALEEAISAVYAEAKGSSYMVQANVGISGWLRNHSITPRGLRAGLLNCLVSVEGIVTRTSVVKPKLVRGVYVADKDPSSVLVRETRDDTPLDRVVHGMDSSGPVPQFDQNKNRYVLEQGLSDFRNYQKFTVQEMPESAPSGQLPASIEVIVEGDLTDLVKAGDRVCVVGIFRCVPRKDVGTVSGYGASHISANNISFLSRDRIHRQVQQQEVVLINRIKGMADPLDHLAHSVCPNLFGGIERKKGLLLQLIGGVRRTLENGATSIRGDIHVLLIGDPSCGKSQMLRFMMNVSKLSISTTGRGSSGVGLTAAVTIDKDSGEKRLEAGAMVMADGGLVCIDEFDKMSYEDRVAIHEVMEQQRVSISKASIQCSLNARCTVLAAANPVYGCFDTEIDLKGQLAFPDSLLSRFDLIYLVHDAATTAGDRKICRAVLSHHVSRPDTGDSDALVPATSNLMRQAGEVDRTDWTVNCRYEDDPNFSNQNITQTRKSLEGQIVYTQEFLKEYIQQAKRYNPRLSKEAIEKIAGFYTELRQRCGGPETNKKLSVPTARSLEAAVRLSTAHARLRMSEVVEERDVKEAKKLLTFTMLGEVLDDSDDSDGNNVDLQAILPPNNNNIGSRKATDGGSTRRKIARREGEEKSKDAPNNKRKDNTGGDTTSKSLLTVDLKLKVYKAIDEICNSGEESMEKVS